MKIEQRYKELLKLREEIDVRLKCLDFEKIKTLVLWLKKSTIFQKLKSEDTQFIMLDCFCNIWIEEKKQLESIGIHEDIFDGVQSLMDVESKYLLIKYCALRIENEVPLEWCERAVEQILENQVSGIAIGTIFMSESREKVNNVVRMSQFLKNKGEVIRAIYLMQYAHGVSPKNADILLELADCWLSVQQWERAYECLGMIEEPDEVVIELMQELEKVK